MGKIRLILSLAGALVVFAAMAEYDIGKEMETEAFWKMDPSVFVNAHQTTEGFKWTSDARDQTDTRRDGAVAWHGHEAYETRLFFGKAGGVDRVEIVFFNTGGTEKLVPVVDANGLLVGKRRTRVKKTMSAEEFNALLAELQGKLTPKGAKMPPERELPTEIADAHPHAQSWPKTTLGTAATLTWDYHRGAKRKDVPKPLFIRLAVDGPGRTAAAAAKGKTAAARPVSVAERAKAIAKNVVRSSNGDVYVDNVPMVDQGAKGYCAVAVTERILRYFGIDVDEHEIAAAAGTDVTKGTDNRVMVKTIKDLSKRYPFAIRVEIGDADEDNEKIIGNLADLVKKYNKAAKQDRKPQIGEDAYVKRTGDTVLYSPQAAVAAMDPQVLKKMKTKGAGKAEYRKFLKIVREKVEKGLPLIWCVTLGMFTESDIPQASGGHMRLIVGINEKDGTIFYSDTWGKGHERKRMPADEAWTITDTLISVRLR